MTVYWAKLDPYAPTTLWDSIQTAPGTLWDVDADDQPTTLWDLKLVQIDNWTKQP